VPVGERAGTSFGEPFELHLVLWQSGAPRGKGIIGMKILGQGDMRTRQNEALKYALSLGVLDAFTIGAESKA
jgi:hypothetical protein